MGAGICRKAGRFLPRRLSRTEYCLLVVVDITSGGEDVADGIYNGTTEAHAALAPAGLDLTWLQLPRGTI